MISENESRAIKIIRVGSMLSIVICHILEEYSNRWAFVFNIGVQVFLVLSGYLYGSKTIGNWGNWAVGRIKRVYVPMFVFLIAVLPLYLIFHREVFSLKAYALNCVNLQGIQFVVIGRGMIRGIRHLWFITAIMFAYMSTPVLQWSSKYADFFFPLLLLGVGVSYLVLPGSLVFTASWVFLYAIGYLYVHLKKKKAYNIILLLLEITIIVFIAMDFDTITNYYHPLNRAFHDLSGVCVVLGGIQLFSHLNIKKIPSIIEYFDKYSFHVFIVHYFLVIGPFSLAHITPYIMLNISVFIVATYIATFLFVKLNNLANRLVFDRILNN